MRNSEFSLVKIGERSRMGLSQLFDTWKSEGYVQPVLKETYDPDRTWVEVEFESTEKRPESTERSTESSSESTEKSTDPRQRWCMGGLEEMRDGFVMERIRFVLDSYPILFVRHLLDGGGVVGCFGEICIILLLFAVTLFACYLHEQQFVKIARKTDETKVALKKSIADVEQVIKGLING